VGAALPADWRRPADAGWKANGSGAGDATTPTAEQGGRPVGGHQRLDDADRDHDDGTAAKVDELLGGCIAVHNERSGLKESDLLRPVERPRYRLPPPAYNRSRVGGIHRRTELAIERPVVADIIELNANECLEPDARGHTQNPLDGLGARS
jgi:hypothetical protein